MNLLKQLVIFYLNSSIHVAISVVSLACITIIEYELSLNFNLLFFLLFSTITGYNFVKYFGVARFHHRSLATRLKYIQIVSFFCFILMCFFTSKLHIQTIYYIVGFGLITFFYAIPFLSKTVYIDKQHNLRSIGGLKIYVIAFVWSGATVLLPFIEQKHALDRVFFISALQRFIFIIVLMLPFEIRDLRYDSLKLATIPQKIGVKQTKIMGYVLLVVILFLEIFKEQTSIKQTGILIIILIITFLFLLFSKIEQRKYYSAFWVESLPVFWLLLVIFFSEYR